MAEPAVPIAPSGPAAAGAVAQVFVDDLDAPEPTPDDAHHLARVLRLRAGDLVVVGDGRGRWRSTEFRVGVPELAPVGPVVVEPRPPVAVTVGFVPAKGDRPEWVVQKLTEAGVDRIVVMASARSVVHWRAERAERAMERLARVAREAAAQSRRAWLPEMTGILDLEAMAAWLAPTPLALAQPGGGPPTAATASVAVGPEGGWDAAELASVTERVGLGRGILRAETAAVSVGILLCAIRDGVVRPVHGDGMG
jgi:16S rRNA (uracil1498-N3)-methyltransferase